MLSWTGGFFIFRVGTLIYVEILYLSLSSEITDFDFWHSFMKIMREASYQNQQTCLVR